MHVQAAARLRQQERAQPGKAARWVRACRLGRALLMRGVSMQVRMQHSQQQRLRATRIHALPAVRPLRGRCVLSRRATLLCPEHFWAAATPHQDPGQLLAADVVVPQAHFRLIHFECEAQACTDQEVLHQRRQQCACQRNWP